MDDMIEADVVARKWGDSIAVIIPKRIVKAEHIKPKDKLHLTLHKEVDLSSLFGKFKTKKTAQQLKDASRKGWE